MIKPLALRLAKRLLTDPRVQAWAMDQVIRRGPRIVDIGRRAASAAWETELAAPLLRRLRRSKKQTPPPT